MQMGFNNTVEHGDRKYHIQTEDLGLKAAKITAQVFRDGAILETITVPYGEKIAGAPSEDARDEAIRHTMRLVHKACYRNIQNGKYDEKPVAAVEEHDEDDEPIVLDADDVEDVEMIDGFVVAGEQDEFEPGYLEAHSRGAPMDLEAEGFQEIRSLDDLSAEVSADFEEVDVLPPAEAEAAEPHLAEPAPSGELMVIEEPVAIEEPVEVAASSIELEDPVAVEPPAEVQQEVAADVEEPAAIEPPLTELVADAGADADYAEDAAATVATAPADDDGDAYYDDDPGEPAHSASPAEQPTGFAYHPSARAFRGLPRVPDIPLVELLNELVGP